MLVGLPETEILQLIKDIEDIHGHVHITWGDHSYNGDIAHDHGHAHEHGHDVQAAETPMHRGPSVPQTCAELAVSDNDDIAVRLLDRALLLRLDWRSTNHALV